MKICGLPKRKNTKRKQKQDCNVVKAIEAVERAATAAVKIYKAVEPVAKAILKGKTK